MEWDNILSHDQYQNQCAISQYPVTLIPKSKNSYPLKNHTIPNEYEFMLYSSTTETFDELHLTYRDSFSYIQDMDSKWNIPFIQRKLYQDNFYCTPWQLARYGKIASRWWLIKTCQKSCCNHICIRGLAYLYHTLNLTNSSWYCCSPSGLAVSNK